MADITVNDETEADDRISQAEELIDAYVGPQLKAFSETLTGMATAGGSTSITLQTKHQNIYDVDYFKLCEVEIIGGTGEGQRKKCIASTKAGVLTVDSAWSTTPSTDSFYKIYQLGKFPRFKDMTFYTEGSTSKYFKSIPEAIKRAVSAQIAFAIEKGDDYMAGDEVDKIEERIGDYAYVKAQGAGGVAKFIAPKAKLLLRGYINRVGQITV